MRRARASILYKISLLISAVRRDPFRVGRASAGAGKFDHVSGLGGGGGYRGEVELRATIPVLEPNDDGTGGRWDEGGSPMVSAIRTA